jgi:hypothetical protein
MPSLLHFSWSIVNRVIFTPVRVDEEFIVFHVAHGFLQRFHLSRIQNKSYHMEIGNDKTGRDMSGSPEGRGMKGEAFYGQLFSATATANRQHKKSAHGNEMAIS